MERWAIRALSLTKMVCATVAKLRANLDEAAITNSVAISTGMFQVLSPLQSGRMMATAYP